MYHLEAVYFHPKGIVRGRLSVRWKPGEWHHLVLNYSAEEFSFYVDGEMVYRRTSNLPPLPPKFEIFKLGFHHVMWRFDELVVEDAPLSPEGVRRHFEETQAAVLAKLIYQPVERPFGWLDDR